MIVCMCVHSYKMQLKTASSSSSFCFFVCQLYMSVCYSVTIVFFAVVTVVVVYSSSCCCCCFNFYCFHVAYFITVIIALWDKYEKCRTFKAHCSKQSQRQVFWVILLSPFSFALAFFTLSLIVLLLHCMVIVAAFVRQHLIALNLSVYVDMYVCVNTYVYVLYVQYKNV